MSNAETRPDRSTDYERPSVDAPLVANEWSEYRCRRCGEHCINRADGEPRGAELCLDCFAAKRAEDEAAERQSVAARERRAEDGEDAVRPSPLRSVRSSLAGVAARLKD